MGYGIFRSRVAPSWLGSSHIQQARDCNKNKKDQKITHTLPIFVDHGIMAHIP